MSDTKSPLGSENPDVSRHTSLVYSSPNRSLIGRVQEQGPDFYEMAEAILATSGIQYRTAYLNHMGGNSL